MDKIALDFPQGPTFVLDSSEVPPCGYWLIGRTTEAYVRLGDPWVSARHAAIEVAPGDTTEGGTQVWDWSIRDMGSSNGTWLNGGRLSPKSAKSRRYPIKTYDKITIGQATFIVGTPDDTEQIPLETSAPKRDTEKSPADSPWFVPTILEPVWQWFTAKGSAEQFIFLLAIGGFAALLLYIWKL